MSHSDNEPFDEPSTKKQRLSSSSSSSGLSAVVTVATLKPRKFQKIPIFIVEGHNDVLNFIFRCLATRHLPLTGNTLIHFDSHPDMVISHHIEPKTVFEKDELLEQLSIENWIMPTCYAGYFNKIVWVKNSWCDQIPLGSHDFHIGDYENEMRIDLPIDYFISEGNYCKTEMLNNSRAVRLQVINSDKAHEEKEESAQLKATTETEGAIVLDIDLDFFSVTNPFLEIYKNVDVYTKLQKIFAYDETGNHEDVAKCRRDQLQELERLFLHLDVKRSLDDFENGSIPSDCYEMIIDLVSSLKASYSDDEIDWLTINDAGNTCDHGGLPHHRSTSQELETYYQNFENFLKQTEIVPCLITIARSSDDDYCPQDQVDTIQKRVIEILQRVYQDQIGLTPVLEYEGESWDVMKL